MAYQRALSQQVYRMSGLPVVEVKVTGNKLDRMARRTLHFEAGHFHVRRKCGIGGAIAVAGRGTSSIALSQILLSYHYTRMIMASPAVTVISGFAGEEDAVIDALRDTYGINDARELGKSIVQIAKATASLRGVRNP